MVDFGTFTSSQLDHTVKSSQHLIFWPSPAQPQLARQPTCGSGHEWYQTVCMVKSFETSYRENPSTFLSSVLPPFYIRLCLQKMWSLFPAISTAWCHESPRSPLKTAMEHGDNQRKRLDLTEVWFFNPCQLWSFDQVNLNLVNPMLHIDIPQNSYDSFQYFSQCDNSAKACNF